MEYRDSHYIQWQRTLRCLVNETSKQSRREGIFASYWSAVRPSWPWKNETTTDSVNIVLSFPRHQNADCRADKTPSKGIQQSQSTIFSTTRQKPRGRQTMLWSVQGGAVLASRVRVQKRKGMVYREVYGEGLKIIGCTQDKIAQQLTKLKQHQGIITWPILSRAIRRFSEADFTWSKERRDTLWTPMHAPHSTLFMKAFLCWERGYCSNHARTRAEHASVWHFIYFMRHHAVGVLSIIIMSTPLAHLIYVHIWSTPPGENRDPQVVDTRVLVNRKKRVRIQAKRNRRRMHRK